MKPTIALFLYDPKCSVQSGNGIMRALNGHYNFKIFSKNEVESEFFDDVDIVAVPGGFGDSDSFDVGLKHNKNRVRDFITNGGRYLGICMGAYWAGHYYFDILKNIEPVQYIHRPGTDTRRPHAKALNITWCDEQHRMFFYDGCSLVGSGVESSDVWARYPNGDAMALIQDRIGVIGCHPESEKFWYDSYNYMKPHWHKGYHHRLLLEFTNYLIKVE